MKIKFIVLSQLILNPPLVAKPNTMNPIPIKREADKCGYDYLLGQMAAEYTKIISKG